MEDSKDLCLCELSLLISTILVIKIEHFQILIHLKFHIMKINIFLLKITIFSKTTKFSETHNRNSHFLHISLMAGLLEDSCILIAILTFKLH